jgi:hypothetical protein
MRRLLWSIVAPLVVGAIFHVDNNGDARSDVEVEVSFGDPDSDNQQR